MKKIKATDEILAKIYTAKYNLTKNGDLSQEAVMDALCALGQAEYYIINREYHPERLLTKSEWENEADTRLTPLPEFISQVQGNL